MLSKSNQRYCNLKHTEVAFCVYQSLLCEMVVCMKRGILSEGDFVRGGFCH